MKTGVVSLGEALIDFIPLDKTNNTYQKSPGGAPANVAVGLAILGVPSTFIGKVGADSLGDFLRDTLSSYGVDVSGMYLSHDQKTNIVLVTLDHKGERSFEFFVEKSADTLLTKDEVKSTYFETNKILHIGSISLIDDPVKSATWKAIHLAKQHHMLLSFDPNIRPHLWSDETVAKSTIKKVLPYVDVLKVSEEELEFLTGSKERTKLQDIAIQYDIPLVVMTKGARGSISYCHDGFVQTDSINIQAVDTTGAGDAFVSALLYMLNERENNLEDLTTDELAAMTSFANVSGGIVASREGAMNALPTIDAIQRYLAAK